MNKKLNKNYAKKKIIRNIITIFFACVFYSTFFLSITEVICKIKVDFFNNCKITEVINYNSSRSNVT